MSGKKGYQLLREESGTPRDALEGEGHATEGDEESILPDRSSAAPAVAALQPPAFRIRILDTSVRPTCRSTARMHGYVSCSPGST